MFKFKSRFVNRNLARAFVILILVVIAIFILFIWKLDSLTPGYSQAEKSAISSSASIAAIMSNPVYAPHKLLQLLFTNLDDTAFWNRLPSVLFALGSFGCLYLILKRWFGKMVAISTTLIFASLPWVILTSRSATPDVIFLSSFYLIASYLWLSTTSRKPLAFLGIIIAATLLAYIPGMIWILVLAAILWRKNVLYNLKLIKKPILFGLSSVFLLGIVPLIVSSLDDVGVLKSILLIPDNLPTIFEFLKSLAWGVLSLVWATREPYALVLGKMPILSVAVIALSVFGTYIMWKRAKTELYLLITLFTVAILGYALSNNLSILTIAMPAFGILFGAGLRYLYAEWRSVFPVNPIPKSLALLLVVSLISLNVVFGIRYALLAWPNAIPTKNTYMIE